MRRRTRSTLFPYTTLFRSGELAEAESDLVVAGVGGDGAAVRDGQQERLQAAAAHLQVGDQNLVANPHGVVVAQGDPDRGDRKSTRLNSSHSSISYAVFCLK